MGLFDSLGSNRFKLVGTIVGCGLLLGIAAVWGPAVGEALLGRNGPTIDLSEAEEFHRVRATQ